MPSQSHATPFVIAILRGITPGEVLRIAEALVERGVGGIEIPLNSPDPFVSIGLLQRAFGRDCLCGAGTVLDLRQVEQLHETGGRLLVAPNTDAAVIRRALELGMVPMPGVGTASEAFDAIAAGATRLKLFPASTYGPAHLRALRAVLPAGVSVCAVGGVDEHNAAHWLRAGVDGYGLGNSLYRPGMTAAEVAARADAFMAVIAAYRKDASAVDA
ncbi:2-dehydro-3-deoxy-6-phosphogalactonate aldolase [Lysobacter sp. ESA13C]|uniref:2-dehydro-3-deoxy-6-phosphogalactonate aldolase n=1 Tax=unclassified Lysobacter TaxID=2635362 RepID=UPI001CBD602C|nr:2-dehydro-3-deoxy-6-phosphogalactonate aldolase [Lysobacter sp. ESA13C]